MSGVFTEDMKVNDMDSCEIITLDEWQRAVLPSLRTINFKKPAKELSDVTLLAYFFWDDDRIDTQFYRLECSFLCAFKNFGLLSSVIVVNRETQRIREFCNTYAVDLQVDPSLSGGGGDPTHVDQAPKGRHASPVTRMVIF